LFQFRNGATGTIATTLKTPYLWRLAIYGSDLWAYSRGETAIAIRHPGGGVEAFDVPAANHIGQNLESFAGAALGQGHYHIDDDAILHTIAALDALFRSTAADGAWQEIG